MKRTNTALLWLLMLLLLPHVAFAQRDVIDGLRPADKWGLNTFEGVKTAAMPFDGLRLRLGGAFSQDFQMLSHENSANAALDANGVNLNQLADIGSNFNTATANLTIDVQLDEGVRMHLNTYLSSRHHTETWVKGGYLQLDRTPFLPVLNPIMEYVSVRIGHMEIDHGDAHYRRTDNGNALHNPFVENYILDAFTTEIGAEALVRAGDLIGVVGVTNGEIKGDVASAGKISPSVYAKVGIDRQLQDDLRVRLTGSVYTTSQSASNTLYGGDRTGSRYYLVMESVTASAASKFTSGRLNPGFRNEVTSVIINPFIKFRGLELFGNYEIASGAAAGEAQTRDVTQLAADVVYRFGGEEDFFVGLRYNTVTGQLAGYENDVTITRIAGSGGWFIDDNVLLKLEYVTQQYDDFDASSIYHGGQFNGLMVNAVVGF